jgi:hypothetical protein
VTKAKKVYKTRVELYNDSLGLVLLPGDEVPEALIKMSPWVIEEGLVIEAAQYDTEQAAPVEDVIIPAPEVTEDTISAVVDDVNENPTAQDAPEDDFSGDPVPSDGPVDDAASSGYQGA